MSTNGEFIIRVRVVRVSRRKFYVFRWDELVDGKLVPRERSSKVAAKRQLRQAAERKAKDLEDELNNPTIKTDQDDLVDYNQTELVPESEVDWDEFCIRFNVEHMSGLSAKSQEAWRTANARFKELINPGPLKLITASTLSRFVGGLRKRKVKETTIATYLRTIMVGLNWAKRVGLIDAAPTLIQPRRSRGITKTMRSRPPTGEEYDRLIAAVPHVRPLDPDRLTELIEGLWLSGLRIGEALRLSWEQDAPFRVSFDGQYPMYRITAEAEKGHSDRILPIAPEFAEWLSKKPRNQRRRQVFRVGLAQSTIEKAIGLIGDKAGVVVNADGKCVTAQDLRRAFGTRWAVRVKPAVLQQLMRHRSIETTMKYYVHFDADEMAAELWKHVPGGAFGGAGFSSTFEQIVKELATA